MRQNIITPTVRETHDMNVQQINLTPDHAQQLLDTMGANRRLSQPAVQRMAGDILEGRWVDNGETIKLNHGGRLIDGQHRCAAVVKAGVSIPIIMVKNLSDHAQDTVDIGRPRSVGDMLTIQGHAYASQIAAVAKLVILYDAHSDQVWSPMIAPSKPEIVTFANGHIELLELVVRDARALQKRIPARVSDFGAFLYLAYSSPYSVEAGDFHNGLLSGANLQDDDARLQLSNFIAGRSYSEAGGIWPTQRNVAIHIKALNTYIQDQPAKKAWFRRESLPMPRIGG